MAKPYDTLKRLFDPGNLPSMAALFRQPQAPARQDRYDPTQVEYQHAMPRHMVRVPYEQPAPPPPSSQEQSPEDQAAQLEQETLRDQIALMMANGAFGDEPLGSPLAQPDASGGDILVGERVRKFAGGRGEFGYESMDVLDPKMQEFLRREADAFIDAVRQRGQ
jgi:hypothetical protein